MRLDHDVGTQARTIDVDWIQERDALINSSSVVGTQMSTYRIPHVYLARMAFQYMYIMNRFLSETLSKPCLDMDFSSIPPLKRTSVSPGPCINQDVCQGTCY
jgi:hypothetical protein